MMPGLRKLFPQQKKPVDWDAVSKPVDPWAGISEDVDPATGLSLSEKAARDAAEKITRQKAEEKAAAARKKAEDKWLLENEGSRPERDTVERIRREMAEEDRLAARAQALVIEAEQNEDKARRAQSQEQNLQAEAKIKAAEQEVSRLAEEQRQWKKGELMRSFAASAERAFRVALPIAGTLLLLAAVLFGARLAMMPIEGYSRNNADAAAPKNDGRKREKPEEPNQPNSPYQPNQPDEPVDNNAVGPRPDGDGTPDNPDPSKWGWDKYFKPDGQPLQPARTVAAPAAPRR